MSPPRSSSHRLAPSGIPPTYPVPPATWHSRRPATQLLGASPHLRVAGRLRQRGQRGQDVPGRVPVEPGRLPAAVGLRRWRQPGLASERCQQPVDGQSEQRLADPVLRGPEHARPQVDVGQREELDARHETTSPCRSGPPARLTGPVGGDVRAVRAAVDVAEPARAVAGQVDEDGVAVVGLAPLEPVVLGAAHHVGHRHRRLDQQDGRQRRVRRGAVQVPVEVVVPDEVGHRSPARQHLVEQRRRRVAVDVPEGGDLVAGVADRGQLGVVAVVPRRVAPARVELRDVVGGRHRVVAVAATGRVHHLDGRGDAHLGVRCENHFDSCRRAG